MKSVVRLLGEYWYFFVHSQLHVVNIRQALKYRLGPSPSTILIMLQSTVKKNKVFIVFVFIIIFIITAYAFQFS